jgi:FK506-binding protein 4/5
LHFKAGAFSRAKKVYGKVAKLFDQETNPDEKRADELAKLKTSAHSNMAACLIKEQNWSEVIDHCTKCLEIDTDNAKALFRRGQAYAQQKDNPEALADLKRADQLTPGNKQIQAYLKTVKVRIAKLRKKEKNIFSNLFDKVNLVSEAELKKAQEKKPDPMSDSSDDDDVSDEEEGKTDGGEDADKSDGDDAPAEESK